MDLNMLGLVLAASAAIDSSRAGAPPVGLTVRFDGGETSQTDHLHSTGLVGIPPPLYLDLALQQRLGGRFFAGLTSGLAFELGPFFYPNIRYGIVDGEALTLGTEIDIVMAGQLYVPEHSPLQLELPRATTTKTPIVPIRDSMALNRQSPLAAGPRHITPPRRTPGRRSSYPARRGPGSPPCGPR